MRVLAIGDIHGCLTALDTLLAAVAPGSEDTVVTLGDYVDRGPDTQGVLNTLIDLQRRVHLVALRGNHELMMLRARQNPTELLNWTVVGGAETLAAYGSLEAIPSAHWQFLERECVDCWENETHLFVHANAYPDMPLYEQPEYMLFWERFRNPPPHESGKVMVCGHTSQKNGLPCSIGHAVCIDTWACGSGWLTCLDCESGKIWQADQAGRQRQFRLNDLQI